MRMNVALVLSVTNSQLAQILLRTSHAHATVDILETEHIVKVQLLINVFVISMFYIIILFN